LHGEETTLADFDSPESSTDYALCMYDESGPPAVVFRAMVPAEGGCRGAFADLPCWRLVSSGYKYRDSYATPEGLLTLNLKPGGPDAAKIIVKTGRKNVTMPTMPLGLPLRVQLQSSTGKCWEATYSSPLYNVNSFLAPAD
jgi:hypothetical protein